MAAATDLGVDANLRVVILSVVTASTRAVATFC
jgi:hypothetical protein